MTDLKSFTGTFMLKSGHFRTCSLYCSTSIKGFVYTCIGDNFLNIQLEFPLKPTDGNWIQEKIVHDLNDDCSLPDNNML